MESKVVLSEGSDSYTIATGPRKDLSVSFGNQGVPALTLDSRFVAVGDDVPVDMITPPNDDTHGRFPNVDNHTPGGGAIASKNRLSHKDRQREHRRGIPEAFFVKFPIHYPWFSTWP